MNPQFYVSLREPDEDSSICTLISLTQRDQRRSRGKFLNIGIAVYKVGAGGFNGLAVAAPLRLEFLLLPDLQLGMLEVREEIKGMSAEPLPLFSEPPSISLFFQ